MPKRRDRSVSFDRYSKSPLRSDSSLGKLSCAAFASVTEVNMKEWEEARCPVCMEPPHNAVLLICSSHDKGCRPYMCDTSYRHSNCLDQFCKSRAETSSATPEQEDATQSIATDALTVEVPMSTIVSPPRDENENDDELKGKLLCPFCRGHVKEWVVVEPARDFMNAKIRSCSCEACSFTGSYKDLRVHARSEHPSARPSEADPERQRSWRRMERQRDIGDLLSTIQSSLGDERSEDSILPVDDGSWLTVFFLIRVFRPVSSHRSRSWSGNTSARTETGIGRRRSSRILGARVVDGETGSSSRDEDESSDGGTYVWRRRVRRRTSPADDQ